METFEIETRVGEYKDVWTLDASLLAEGRETELEARLSAMPALLRYLARKSGARPLERAEMDAVHAFAEAQDRGEPEAELDNLLDVATEASLRAREGDAAALEFRKAAARRRGAL